MVKMRVTIDCSEPWRMSLLLLAGAQLINSDVKERGVINREPGRIELDIHVPEAAVRSLEVTLGAESI
jgi:hypothetical protein